MISKKVYWSHAEEEEKNSQASVLNLVVKPHGKKKFTALIDVKRVMAFLKEAGYV